jgi:hypothetical protein
MAETLARVIDPVYLREPVKIDGWYYAVPTQYGEPYPENLPDDILMMSRDLGRSRRELALRLLRDEWYLSGQGYSDGRVALGNKTWLVLTAEEAGEAMQMKVETLSKLLPLPAPLHRYFDFEMWRDDQIKAGAGILLSDYDNEEKIVELDCETFYIYRQS